MMDKDLMEQLRRTISAADFSADNARVAKLEAEIDELSAASSKAAQRQRECVGQLIALNEQQGYSARTMADALLAGTVVSAPDVAALRAEDNALGKGIQELENRAAAKRREVEQIKEGVRQQVLALLRPLAEAAADQARASGMRILQAYAAISAVTVATRSFDVNEKLVGQAVAGLRQHGKNGALLAQQSRDVKVPPDVAALLGLLDDKGAAVRLYTPDTIKLP